MRLKEALAAGDAHARAGRYFEAHEALEAYWMKAEGAEKVLLQGLVQVAAGLHRLRTAPDKTDGAFYLLDRGLEKVTRNAALLDAPSWRAFEDEVKAIRAAGKAPDSLGLPNC